MKSPAQPAAACRVVGGEKLPAASGGADALCSAVEKALAAQAKPVSVEVQVVQPWQLAAVVRLADGRTLPEQGYAISDSGLNARAFQEFAASVAKAVAAAR